MSRPDWVAEVDAAGQTDWRQSPSDAARAFARSLAPGVRVLVALSGGSDSTGLLVALWSFVRETGSSIKITAATVDHGLRPESAAEAVHVGALCRKLDIEHTICRWEGQKPKTGLMAAARLARYRLLQDAAQAMRCDFVLTGHTLDDQLETVAMRQVRGADPQARGLAGMSDAVLFDGKTWICRPFLDVRRADIRQMLQVGGFGWIDDPSNENHQFERVRVRGSSSAGISSSDVAKAGRVRLDLSCSAARILLQTAESPAPGYFTLFVDPEMHDAWILALTTLIAIAGGRTFLPGQETMAMLLQDIANGQDFRRTLSRTVVERRKNILHISRERRNLPSIVVKGGDDAVWDERFRVFNDGETDVRISAGGGLLRGDDGVPPRVAARVAAVGARVETGDLSAVRVEPYLAPFEGFLPGFDFELASAAAKLTRRSDFPVLMSWNSAKK